jgi:glutathione transport system permease protein
MIARRLLVSMPALVGVLFLCFCLLQVVPTDPALIIAGPDAKAETVAAIREELGLDRPHPDPVRRVHRARGAGRPGPLDHLATSRSAKSSQTTVGPTTELMVGAMVLAVPIGPAAGHAGGGAARLAARPRRSWRSRWPGCRCRCSSSA